MTKKLIAFAASLSLLAGAAGCDSLLEVSNPANIAGDDILDPVAAEGLKNMAEAGVARGYGSILTSYSTVTDELQWSGSRDAYQQLDFGTVSNAFNEFLDAQYPVIAQGNWMAREAVRILEIHQADGVLSDPMFLADTYVALAFSHVVIGNMFRDWAFSDRAAAAAPVGPGGMQAATFDQAITVLDQALAIAPDGSDTDNLALALKAQARHLREVWSAARTPGSGALPTSAGLTQAAADAQAAITALGGATTDWVHQFLYSSQSVSATVAGQVNDRQEMRFSMPYASPDPNGAPTFDDVVLTDLIDVGTVSPILDQIITDFDAGDQFPPLTIVSTREMHLIIAEERLAAGDMTGFATAINAVRTMDGLTAFDGAAPQVPAAQMLSHMRATNLFLQGKRLADMYRFGDTSPDWQNPELGQFFPITVIECRANENIPDNC